MIPGDARVHTLFVFDADNTLWDTNAVFRTAQLALLQPYSDVDRKLVLEQEFLSLRQMDRDLLQRLGRFEYDFRFLALALAHRYFHNHTVEEAICLAMENDLAGLSPTEVDVVERAYHSYTQALRQLPPLFPDTIPLLRMLREERLTAANVCLTLFSEGDPHRLEHILEAHSIRQHGLFDEICIGTKSRESFLQIQQAGHKRLRAEGNSPIKTVVIGDSLKREIKFGNQIGGITVYIPADFMGREEASCDDERPDYVLERLGDLPLVIG